MCHATTGCRSPLRVSSRCHKEPGSKGWAQNGTPTVHTPAGKLPHQQHKVTHGYRAGEGGGGPCYSRLRRPSAGTGGPPVSGCSTRPADAPLLLLLEACDACWSAATGGPPSSTGGVLDPWPPLLLAPCCCRLLLLLLFRVAPPPCWWWVWVCCCRSGSTVRMTLPVTRRCSRVVMAAGSCSSGYLSGGVARLRGRCSEEGVEARQVARARAHAGLHMQVTAEIPDEQATAWPFATTMHQLLTAHCCCWLQRNLHASLPTSPFAP
jgi:hypothetical protein